MSIKIIAQNKKALFDYEILEEYIAGVRLTGAEIKSIRLGNVNLKGSYVSLHHKTLWLKNSHIAPYKYDSSETYDPLRERELLVKKSELTKIENQLNTEGVTLVPLSVLLQNHFAKIKIAIAKGRKKFDKRQVIKERMVKRQIDRQMRKY